MSDTKNPAVDREPPPSEGSGPPIVELVVADVDKYRLSKIAAELADDLRVRAEVGRKKYGTLLMAYNGRDPIVDAYQEALDLVMYLRQAREEARGVGSVTVLQMYYEAALALAFDLRNIIRP